MVDREEKEGVEEEEEEEEEEEAEETALTDGPDNSNHMDSEADEAVKVLEQLTQHPPEDIGVVIKGVEIQHQSRSRYPAPVPAPDHQTRHGGENRSSPGATRPQGSTTIDLWVWGSLV
ncbi:uncharacterized protein LOC123482012 isoform X2 [Coregonus clupeaformis]|uniref:uncharacterized protein LOC123482012 isoform X2 n=1 Tax=Coregonus clupeaformis TaxID=59861 RepID=UPI001E1C7537|nr:uncharacterized protein LOC123482012 isoform X2 [Coregonus clupeaformis]